MKLTAMALAFAFALSSTCAFAHTVRHEKVRTPSQVQECCAVSRLASEIWQSEPQFERVRERRCVGPLGRLLWAHDSLRRRR